MSNCRKSWQKKCVPTRCLSSTLLLLAILSLFACAGKSPQTINQVPLENPTRFLKTAPDAIFEQGYAQYQKGNFRKARSEFGKKIKSSPDHSPSYLAVGYTYIAEGNLDVAEKYIRKSLELLPEYAQAHSALAYTFELRQDYDGALSELSEVAQINPDYPSLQQTRNVLKLKATEKHLEEGHRLADSDPQQALMHLERAMDLAPEVSQTPVEIAEILLRNNNCQEAVPYLETANQRTPDNPDVKKQLGQCLIQLNELDRALVVYQELSALRPDDAEVGNQIDSVKKMILIRNLPEEYHSIPTAEQITRGQLAAYLMLNLEFLQRYSLQDSQIITDTLGHWGQSLILKTVNLGIIDLFPNRTFQPELPLTRLELAKAASRILEILELNEHKAVSQAQTSPIPDVAGHNIYYSMISKALSAGVLTLDSDGRFHPSRSVSGAELLSVVNRLRDLAE